MGLWIAKAGISVIYFFLQLETTWKKQTAAGLHPTSKERVIALQSGELYSGKCSGQHSV